MTVRCLFCDAGGEYINSGSKILVMAIHAGVIEPQTDLVAIELARRLGASYWIYRYNKGESKVGSCQMFNGADRYGLRKLLCTYSLIVSIHGHGIKDDNHPIYVGGAHNIGAFYLRQELTYRGLRAPVPPKKLAGNSPYNICNRAGPLAHTNPFVVSPNGKKVRVGLACTSPPSIGPGIQIELPCTKLNDLSNQKQWFAQVYDAIEKGVCYTFDWLRADQR